MPPLSLPATYRRAARPWSLDELAETYRLAIGRGAESDPADPSHHPIQPLSTAIPRLVRLAAAVHILHVLPTRASERTPNGLAIVDQLLSTLDQTAAGALYLCHLALEAVDRDDPVDDWVSSRSSRPPRHYRTFPSVPGRRR